MPEDSYAQKLLPHAFGGNISDAWTTPVEPQEVGKLLASLDRVKPPLADTHARNTGYETVGPPDPPRPVEPPMAVSHIQHKPGEPTIGASRQGERYEPPSFNEMMGMKNPLFGVAEHVMGAARPPSVYAQDPTGVDTWLKNPSTQQAPLISGETEEVGNLARSILPAAEGIRVYHGSPHSFAREPGAPFGRFREDKIGTGQGAASYGHGHYLAEAEPVATDYRNMLSRNASGQWHYEGEAIPDPAGDLGNHGTITQALHLAGHPEPGESMDAFLRRRIPDMEARAEYNEKAYGHRSPWRMHADTLRNLDADQLAYRPAGHMYEARIQTDPANFLDWDTQLKKQSPQVQEALARLGTHPEPSERIWVPHQVTAEDLAAGHLGPAMQPGEWTAVQKDPAGNLLYHTGQTYTTRAEAASLSDLRNAGRRSLRVHDTGEGLYANLSQAAGDTEASARLRDAGLPGIRYLDQFSRNAAYNPLVQDMIGKYGSREGALKVAQQHLHNASFGSMRYWENVVENLTPPQTRNYVVFPGNEKLIEILREYGLVPPIAAGMLGHSQQDQ